MEIKLCEIGQATEDGHLSWSPFVSKVHRALQLHGFRYERIHRSRPDQWKELNPLGQVPILMLDGEVIVDSTQILERLEKVSLRSLVPEDPGQAAEAWIWEDYADATLNGFVGAARWADDRNWPMVRREFFGGLPLIPKIVRKRIVSGLAVRGTWNRGAEACWREFGRTLDLLEARLPTDGFLFGEFPSVGDVAIFAQLHALRGKLTPWQREEILSRRVVSSFLDRVQYFDRAQADELVSC